MNQLMILVMLPLIKVQCGQATRVQQYAVTDHVTDICTKFKPRIMSLGEQTQDTA